MAGSFWEIEKLHSGTTANFFFFNMLNLKILLYSFHLLRFKGAVSRDFLDFFPILNYCKPELNWLNWFAINFAFA